MGVQNISKKISDAFRDFRFRGVHDVLGRLMEIELIFGAFRSHQSTTENFRRSAGAPGVSKRVFICVSGARNPSGKPHKPATERASSPVDSSLKAPNTTQT